MLIAYSALEHVLHRRCTTLHINSAFLSSSSGVVLSWWFDWHGRYGVVITGAIPSDLPSPMFPLTSDWPSYTAPSAINMINIIIASSVIFKYFAAVNKDKVTKIKRLGKATKQTRAHNCAGARGL